MESRLGYSEKNSVQPQEIVFEDIYHRVQGEYGVEGVVSLVRYLTQTALEQREQILKSLEEEARSVKLAIDMINEVIPNKPVHGIAKNTY